MATSLLTEDCSSTALANELFSTTEGLLVLIPQRGCQNPFSFTIPSGCYALVTSKGVHLDYLSEDGVRSAVWPPGLHFPYPPWYRISFLITAQSILFEVPVKSCKTLDGVTVDINVGVTFRIMGETSLGEDSYLVRKFAYRLKPSGLEQQLRGAVEALIRGLVKKLYHNSIYAIRSNRVDIENVGVEGEESESLEVSSRSAFISDTSTAFGVPDDNRGFVTPERLPSTNRGRSENTMTEDIKEALDDQFTPQGIQILSVAIKNVSLPTNIQSQMGQGVKVASAKEEENMEHIQDMYNSRMEEEMQGLIQTFSEERQQESQLTLEKINSEKVQLEDAIALSKKAEAEIREDARIRIEKIVQKQSYEIQQSEDTRSTAIASTLKQAKLYSAKLKAETTLETQSQLSEARIVSEKNLAEVQKVMASAEGEIAQWVKKRNEFNLSLQKIKNLEALAENEDVIISPSSSSHESIINVADSILHGGKKKSSDVAKIAAEVEMMKIVSVVTPEKEEDIKNG